MGSENALSEMTQALNNITNAINGNSVISMILTIVSGVIVFVICEYLKEIWLTPLREYKKMKQQISETLIYYAHYYTNVIDSVDENSQMIEAYQMASDKMRVLASALRGFIETLSWIKPGIPSKRKLYEASSYLILLSNGFFCPFNTHAYTDSNERNQHAANSIRLLLGIMQTQNAVL